MSTNTLIPQANPQNKCCRRASLQSGSVSELYIAGGPKDSGFSFPSCGRLLLAVQPEQHVCLEFLGKQRARPEYKIFLLAQPRALVGAVLESVARLAGGGKECRKKFCQLTHNHVVKTLARETIVAR